MAYGRRRRIKRGYSVGGGEAALIKEKGRKEEEDHSGAESAFRGRKEEFD